MRKLPRKPLYVVLCMYCMYSVPDGRNTSALHCKTSLAGYWYVVTEPCFFFTSGPIVIQVGHVSSKIGVQGSAAAGRAPLGPLRTALGRSIRAVVPKVPLCIWGPPRTWNPLEFQGLELRVYRTGHPHRQEKGKVRAGGEAAFSRGKRCRVAFCPDGAPPAATVATPAAPGRCSFCCSLQRDLQP